MTAQEIVKWLGARDIRLRVRDGKLVIEGDKALLSQEIVERIKARKDEIMAYLWPTQPAALVSDEKGAECPAGEITCRACATYEDREGHFCAYSAVFEQKGRRPNRVRAGSACPRRESHFSECRECG